jgi:hypothetical protein
MPTPLGWFSPSPPVQHAVQLQGKTLRFVFAMSKSAFHGPATYPNAFEAGAEVGSDTLLKSNSSTSSVTLNGDGSGHASFPNLYKGTNSTSLRSNPEL